MADRMIHISWGASIAGREEHGLDVFNEALGLYGRMQQEGRIESFDVALLVPNGGPVEGYINLNGSAAQLATVREDDEYLRTMTDASLVVHDLCICDGFVNDGVAKEMTVYKDAIGRVPQMA
jgi:hypothetical protein